MAFRLRQPCLFFLFWILLGLRYFPVFWSALMHWLWFSTTFKKRSLLSNELTSGKKIDVFDVFVHFFEVFDVLGIKASSLKVVETIYLSCNVAQREVTIHCVARNTMFTTSLVVEGNEIGDIALTSRQVFLHRAGKTPTIRTINISERPYTWKKKVNKEKAKNEGRGPYSVVSSIAYGKFCFARGFFQSNLPDLMLPKWSAFRLTVIKPTQSNQRSQAQQRIISLGENKNSN